MQLSACQFYSDSIRKRREWKGGGSFAPLLVRLVASRLPSTRIISKRCEFIGHSRERREREREKRERDVAEEGRQSRKSTHQTANITCFGHEGSACEDPCKVPSKRSRTEGVIRNSARKCKLFTPRYGPRKRPISIGIRGFRCFLGGKSWLRTLLTAPEQEVVGGKYNCNSSSKAEQQTSSRERRLACMHRARKRKEMVFTNGQCLNKQTSSSSKGDGDATVLWSGLEHLSSSSSSSIITSSSATQIGIKASEGEAEEQAERGSAGHEEGRGSEQAIGSAFSVRIVWPMSPAFFLFRARELESSYRNDIYAFFGLYLGLLAC